MSGEPVYAGFWRRFGALWVDLLFLMPVLLLTFWLLSLSRQAPLYLFIPNLVFSFWFNVLLVAKYGGTPGKLLLHTRITMVDGSPVTLKAAFLRYAIGFGLSIPGTLAIVLAALRMSDAEYFALTFVSRMQRLAELAPAWYQPADWCMNLWTWSEFLTMMFNKRRRALHDFMAGTVVIRQWRSGYAPVNEATATGAPPVA